jgi:desumoylating isopeptidase 1
MSQQLVGKYFEGIWHTGICVYNKEFYYGGGISYDRMGRTPFGNPTKSLSLGFTEIHEELFMEFLQEV